MSGAAIFECPPFISSFIYISLVSSVSHCIVEESSRVVQKIFEHFDSCLLNLPLALPQLDF